MRDIDSAAAAAAKPMRRPLWAFAIAAALVAVAATSVVDVLYSDRFNEVPAMAGGGGDATRQAEAASGQAQLGAILNGTLGGLLGLGLGAAGGLSRRSARAAVAAALFGAIGAGGAGLMTPNPMVKFYDRNEVTTPDESGGIPMEMVVPLAAHAGIWVPIGAIAGLALGWGAARKAGAGRGLAGGLAGALMATLLYEVLGAILFPASGAESPVANGFDARILASALVATLTTIAAAAFVLSGSRGAKGTLPAAESPPEPSAV